MDRMEELERAMLSQKPEVPLSKKAERLLDLARQRAKKGGCVERRHPAVFDLLVERGLLTEDGKYIKDE
jgi:hypothetical protein